MRPALDTIGECEMKKIISVVLLFCLAAALLLPAALADGSLELQYDLNIDGSNDYKAKSGEIITVSFTLRRLDTEEGYSYPWDTLLHFEGADSLVGRHVNHQRELGSEGSQEVC